MPLPAERALALLLTVGLGLSGCAGGGGRPAVPRMASDDAPRVGVPYEVGGRTYTPADDAHYDMIGIASWYGDEHRGQPTASGEPFDPDAITAAHPTLPLPSYAEVTSLDSGTIILVRINDRGPFAGGRIIDLSRGAARLLGIERQGSARVRVRRVDPNEADRAALRAGRPAAERLPAPPQLLAGLNARVGVRPAQLPSIPAQRDTPSAPPPAAPALPSPALASVSASASGGRYVQVAALSNRARADALAATLADIGPTDVQPAGGVFRVRIGPVVVEAAARTLAEAKRRGYQDARIVR